MQLSEILEYLMYGDLANLAIGSDEEGRIREKDLPKVISNINLGLIDLHKRFPILSKAVGIELYEHISDYILDKKYSYTLKNPEVRYHYLMDNHTEPFNNDVIKIERVFTEEYHEFPLNVENDSLSLYTPSYNRIQVPYPIQENVLLVEYRAYPARIEPTIADPSSVYVELPEALLECLVAYVSDKLYSRVGKERPEANLYLQKYELECNRIDSLGVFNTTHRGNLKLEINQWV
jgi:hypothetical protein